MNIYIYDNIYEYIYIYIIYVYIYAKRIPKMHQVFSVLHVPRGTIAAETSLKLAIVTVLQLDH